jgi:hypothetical protein
MKRAPFRGPKLLRTRLEQSPLDTHDDPASSGAKDAPAKPPAQAPGGPENSHPGALAFSGLSWY